MDFVDFCRSQASRFSLFLVFMLSLVSLLLTAADSFILTVQMTVASIFPSNSQQESE